jgi:hypothetical protein
MEDVAREIGKTNKEIKELIEKKTKLMQRDLKGIVSFLEKDKERWFHLAEQANKPEVISKSFREADGQWIASVTGIEFFGTPSLQNLMKTLFPPLPSNRPLKMFPKLFM